MSSLKYHMDLDTFSLLKLKNLFKTTRLLPSQTILQEKIDERFKILEENGIQTLKQLQNVLKTKSHIQSFTKATGLTTEYLNILRREVNSYQPKPINIKEFPGIDPDVVRKLLKKGIKNTLQLFPHVLTQKDRGALAEQNQISYEEILELTKLTDVVRTKWVGPKFARLLIESPYDTVEKIAVSNPEELFQALVRTNEECQIYKGKFGIEDLRLWINVAVQDVPRVIEY